MYCLLSKTQDYRPRGQRPSASFSGIARTTNWSHIAKYVSATGGEWFHVVDGGGRVAADPAAVIPVKEFGAQLLVSEGDNAVLSLPSSTDSCADFELPFPFCGSSVFAVPGVNTLAVGGTVFGCSQQSFRLNFQVSVQGIDAQPFKVLLPIRTLVFANIIGIVLGILPVILLLPFRVGEPIGLCVGFYALLVSLVILGVRFFSAVNAEVVAALRQPLVLIKLIQRLFFAAPGASLHTLQARGGG